MAGVDEVEAICRVPGIDGVAVGAYDLAASMGHPGDPWREDVQAVVDARPGDVPAPPHAVRHGAPRPGRPRAPDRAGCQLITVATLEWGIQATRDAVAELSELTPRAA